MMGLLNYHDNKSTKITLAQHNKLDTAKIKFYDQIKVFHFCKLKVKKNRKEWQTIFFLNPPPPNQRKWQTGIETFHQNVMKIKAKLRHLLFNENLNVISFEKKILNFVVLIVTVRCRRLLECRFFKNVFSEMNYDFILFLFL